MAREALFLADVLEGVNKDVDGLRAVLERAEMASSKIVEAQSSDPPYEYEPTDEEKADLHSLLEIRQALLLYRLERAMLPNPDEGPRLVRPDEIDAEFRRQLLR